MKLSNIEVISVNPQRTKAAASWQDGEARYHFWFDLKTRRIDGLDFSNGKPVIYKNSLVMNYREPGYFNVRYLDATNKKNAAIIAAVWDEINAKELVGKAILAEDAADLKRKQEQDEAAFEYRKTQAGPEMYAILDRLMNTGLTTGGGEPHSELLGIIDDAAKLIAKIKEAK